MVYPFEAVSFTTRAHSIAGALIDVNTSACTGLPDTLHYNSGMTDGPVAADTDPHWPKVLSLTAHELRSPLSVVAGYIRMVLRDRRNPPSDMHRRLLEPAAESCGRLSALLDELSDLSRLESGTAPYNRSNLVLKPVLTDAIAALPDLTDRSLAIELSIDGRVRVHGDAVRLRSAFVSLLHAIRREIVLSDRLLVRVETTPAQDHSIRITLAEPSRIDEIARLDAGALVTFDEWRGGNGLALPNARRIIEAHGGRILSPAEAGKASAVILLPALRT
jgi:signal transduction histidine kinase